MKDVINAFQSADEFNQLLCKTVTVLPKESCGFRTVFVTVLKITARSFTARTSQKVFRRLKHVSKHNFPGNKFTKTVLDSQHSGKLRITIQNRTNP